MRLLALDTALAACAACVLDSSTREVLARESAPLERGQSEALLPLVERVVSAAGGFAGIDRVAVTVGPGSYTGLRVGISAARAIGLGLERPVVGVSTLSALAAPLVAAGEGGPIAAAIDARHGRVYLQLVASNGRPLVAPCLLPLREAVRAVGPGLVRLTGSGAPLLGAEARALGQHFIVVDAAAAPQIEWVARLGALADAGAAPPKPLYLRAPDAAPQDAARIARA